VTPQTIDGPQAREDFLRDHAGELYAELTDGFRESVRVEDLVYRAAERVPGLVPTREVIAAERRLRLADKRGAEIDQGVFVSHVMADRRAGRHLVHAMMRPKREAEERLDAFRTTGQADLGVVHVSRRDGIGTVEFRNLRYLNAEDDVANAATETAVDLVLLDPDCTVGVLRGGVVDHPRHAGRRIFSSGLNLTHLYHGMIPFADFFMARELGLLNKMYRGHWFGGDFERDLEDTAEKPWIAAVESWAIGGGCQLLLIMDRVIAERRSYFNLPARKEGIIPGLSDGRLPRLLGERMARQAVMFERVFQPDSPDGALLCDRVVEDSAAMDSAIVEDATQLVSAGVVSAAANRKAIRIGLEPVDDFRRCMAVYAREQARCLFNRALVENLDRNWNAGRRRL
jgi:(3,5-dihydroxyphenyl)acetyl-CoA 1,2-dioxygenase